MEGTLQNAEDLLSSPPQTLLNAEDLLSSPPQTLLNAEDLLPCPTQTLHNPEDLLSSPPQTLLNAEDLLSSPPQTLLNAEDLLPCPTQTLHNPEDLLPSPPQTLQNPEDLLPSPSQTLQNPEDLLPSPTQTLKNHKDITPRHLESLPNKEDLHSSFGANDSGVSKTHQDIHPGLTEHPSPSKKPHLNQSQLSPGDADAPTAHQVPPSPVDGLPSCEAPPGGTRLCGFLQKQGGPLKTWKWRWFTYEGSQNQLFYYRTQHDVTPLGQVLLDSATFTYPLPAECGTFHIQTPERTLVLKAVTQDLMMFWLQQLQLRRWRHRQPTSAPESPDEFLPVLKVPLGLVGEDTDVPSKRSSLTNLSIKHPIIELQNSVHHLRQRSSQDCTTVQEHHPTAGLQFATSSLPLVDVGPRQMQKSPSTTQQYLEQEVKAHKELVQILHKALESAQLEKRSCAEFLAAEGEQQRLEVLRHRERLLVDLQQRLEEAQSKLEETRAQLEETRCRLRDKDILVENLQREIQMLMEKNDLNHEVILKLSERVPDSLPPNPYGPGLLDSRVLQQLENLKDDLDAYKTQNQFLNSEIHHLMQLWRRSSEQEKVLMVKCSSLEAELCQLEGRHLEVLRTLQKHSLDQEEQAAVQDMIRIALREARGRGPTHLNRDYDEYGFKILPDYEVEDMKLLAKIQALEIRTHYIRNQNQDGAERSLHSRWAQYLTGRLDQDLVPSPELKSLLRAGVPQEYRPLVWRWLIKARTRSIREQHSDRYRQLCEKTRTSSHPVLRQIQLDIHRTLTNNRNFCSPSSPALQQLRRVLLAFSWQNPRVGYCQGLNRLAALALLVLQSEEEAFWCLVAVVDCIMPPDYYTHQLVASQVDQRVLKELLMEKLPRLGLHLDQHGIDVSLVTFNWFLVVFVESLPSDILLPLWDSFLYEGSKVMFRFALALFKYKENDFLKINDSVEIYRYLRFFTKTISDSRKLSNIAFTDMNPFPGRQLRNRRLFHLERLKGELRELEEQQREFQTESTERRDKDLDNMVSEDDEDL
ncbi:TBC1 domain family member 2A isoform X1 [Synchiropus splendidus]|uniref:TBC1 domain family member 2A isoform X1 n=1 Tax=Synchiropus splendidus TaxID=270530 RepID=UPI00237E13B4|nr:TBC1 domain family member 2A isoform X1 [Synchiropus splendidus]XP_053735289.1 TBC1 domain family member 2A isoform X1 [Synchiropus splendidus]XP_053735290.1 TBC1 domain family member 2A isoform X1 [Synchiropus splendidus]XP_053735291.1 TBC1 domain family member 2A isoform X1 [Synchiropus splendidus]XP_053735292.1 TBC1 domain family member 2A isoform X1 [Synchiropus splendidus]XP_053735293.1 TBC1 domain family member 2A isoform X1 [Synchiropus splendidus]